MIISFKKFISENYKNFIGSNSKDQREKWVDQVWEILQKSYSPLGGIKGGGFASKQDMIDNIPFWKIYTRNDKVIAAAFYKDKGGRKSVAVATDGSDLGKKIVQDMFKAGLKTSYGEKSGPSLGVLMKSIDWDVLRHFLIKPEEIEKITGEKIVPLAKYGYENLSEKDKITHDKFPQLKPYFYLRELGGEMRLKVSVGTPNLKIKS